MFIYHSPDTVLEQRSPERLRVAPVTPIYRVSVIVPGRRDIGAVQHPAQEPQLGDKVVLRQEEFRIMDIVELMPPRENFIYLQATCQPIAS